MLTTFLITLIILVICVALMCIKILLVKGGRFPNLHIEGNAALRKKGICCAKTEARRESQRKNLFEILKSINE